jgi:hypothetical protein
MDILVGSLVDGIAMPVVTGIMAYLITLLRAKFNLSKDSILSGMLEAAVQNGITLAANRVKEGGGSLSVADKSQLVQIATEYAIASVPQAINHFKIKDRLSDFIEVRLIKRSDIPTAHNAVQDAVTSLSAAQPSITGTVTNTAAEKLVETATGLTSVFR